MWMAPIRSSLGDQKRNDYEGSMDDWYSFVHDTKTSYGVDMNVLTKPFSEEQKKYYLQVNFKIFIFFRSINIRKCVKINRILLF